MNHTAQTIKAAFEALTPASLPALVALYDADARFVDPFNNVRGAASVGAIFAHMFTQVGDPRFTVSRIIESKSDEGDEGKSDIFMRWDFTFVARGKPQHIHGATHFELNATGLITLHRDYWDAAQELYEKLPLLGSLLRWIRSKLAVPPTSMSA
jgi:steroid Delta-isomerase